VGLGLHASVVFSVVLFATVTEEVRIAVGNVAKRRRTKMIRMQLREIRRMRC
jgi:hypothetical protein